jgi:hypothetical protein
MGLDMYLNRYPKVESVKEFNKLKSIDAETNEELCNKAKEINENFDEERHFEKSEIYTTGWIGKEVGYWRKANHIHNWFVENVQDGVDECLTYRVPKEKLEELLNVAERSNSLSNAKKFLPTRGGFFFGSIEYDEGYYQDNISTIKIITKILEETDWDKEEIYYRSSW